MPEFWIDIENAAGVKQGNGPIVSASRWEYTARLDAAGDFRFLMPAGDPKAAHVQKRQIARAYAYLAGQRVEVGAGIIDHIEARPQDDGEVWLEVSGNDLIRELTYRSVLDLKLYSGGNPVSHATAVAAVAGYAPAGWTVTPDPAPPNNNIYGYFNGESVLAGLIKTAQKSQSHFYRGSGRTLTFGSSFAPSGIRAVKAQGDLSAAQAAITSLTQIIDLYDLRTRIYPRGSGNAAVQLKLRATTRSAPAGYVLNKTANYLENSAYVTSYGVVEEQVDFRDIGPVSNTTPDIVSASNMLFDAALEYLKQHSVELDQPAYEIALAGCSQLLHPLQTIRLVYRDLDQLLDIDADLNILEATWSVTQDAIGTTELKVSSNDRLPDSDQSVAVGAITEGRVYQALPQLNANSYVTSYRANVDRDHNAFFRFRFGAEVTQLQQVMFEFQVLAFESTVKSVGGVTAGSGALPTGVPSINDTGAGGNNDSGPGGAGDTSAAAVTTATTTLNTATTSLGTATANLNTATIGLSTATAALTSSSTSLDTSSVGLSTGSPTGGDTGGGGQHVHNISITLGATVSYPIGYGAAGAAGGLVSSLPGSSDNPPTTGSGNHTHSISGHTHTIAAHSHTIAAHSHTIAAHSHTIAAHSHTIAAHSHTIAAHSHTIAAHSHTTAAHTHSMSNHTHSLNNHTHSLADALSAVYGVYREEALYTYTYDKLEYSVNGGAWVSTATSVDAGDGWRQIDITDLVMDADTFRPLQTNNSIEMRAAAGAGLIVPILAWSLTGSVINIITTTDNNLNVGDKIVITDAGLGVNYGVDINGSYPVQTLIHSDIFTINASIVAPGNDLGSGGNVSYPLTGTIDAQLSVRNVIQAIAYV